MANEKPGFLLYHNQKIIIDELTDQEAGVLIKAVFEYEVNKKIPKLNKMLKIIFLQFKNILDSDDKHYNEKCAKNAENIKKYWEKKKQEKDTNVYDRIQMYTNNNSNNNNNINNNNNSNNNSNNNNNNNKKDIYTRVALDDTQLFSEIIACFNKIGIKEDSFKKNKIEFHFKNSKSNQELIKNILDKGYTKEDIFDVIYLKYEQWIENKSKNKMDMTTYYRPSTILGDKFEEYYEEARMKEIS